MTSFVNGQPSKRKRTYLHLLADIRHALNEALTEEAAARHLTQAEIARELGKSKSFVSRKLSGMSNMTLETLADLAFALDRPVRVTLPSRHRAGNANFSAGNLRASASTTGTTGKMPIAKALSS
ncbi:XRE family transcriptional regulator [Nitrospirillum viridazoti Y2]|uniref:helix-turn-helix domain-containing protein n=1 Tax=Nitrospirillum viridazoti TaxID=3144925 RepID=UPI0002265DFB|nr:helix-turn-helix transcriptional regulator [Nitrospirillum amazonense]EGX99741.1 XRE family transcriptional regulator [Nitrospirillum amazonense Y2]